MVSGTPDNCVERWCAAVRQRNALLHQVGRVHPRSSTGTTWQVAPLVGFFYLPFWLDYVIIDIDADNYNYMVCSSPTRTGMAPWMYIMTRSKQVSESALEPLRASAAAAGWDMSKASRVPHADAPAGAAEN